MQELNDKKKEKLKKAILDGKVTDETTLGVFQMVAELEDEIDTLKEDFIGAIKQVKESEVNLDKVLESVRGKDGKTPIKGKDYFDGKDGENYILTPQDKQDIAKGIKVPIVEKIITQKTEVIKEIPIVTNITEIKEVAVLDPDLLPQYGTKFRDGLELLKEDDRLDISAIKGLSKRERVLTDSIINRAIGIVDQRTSFLIQKVSNLTTTVNNINPVETQTLANISALSTDATKSLYTMTSTIPVEFKTSGGTHLLYLDESNERVGIGTASPTSKLQIANTDTATANNQIMSLNLTGTLTARATVSDVMYASQITPVLTASANTQTLYGLDISPTYSLGAFTGSLLYPLNVKGYAGALVRVKALTSGNTELQLGDPTGVGNSTSLRFIRPSGGYEASTITQGNANLTFDNGSFGGFVFTPASGSGVQINGTTYTYSAPLQVTSAVSGPSGFNTGLVLRGVAPSLVFEDTDQDDTMIASEGGNIYFKSASGATVTRAIIGQTNTTLNTNLIFDPTNTYDIGATGATGQVKDVHIGGRYYINNPTGSELYIYRSAVNTMSFNAGSGPMTWQGTILELGQWGSDVTLKGPVAGGTNRAAQKLVIKSGTSSGNGAAAGIDFYFSGAVGASGSTESTAVKAWSIDATGNFIAGTDNTYDIGANGATRPKDLFLGGKYVGSTQALSGAGAANVTTETTKITSTGVLDAISLADGVDGQTKIIIHDVDGGSFVLTPTTKTGWTTFTSTIAGESITLKFVTTRGWIVTGSYLGVIA